MSNFIQKGDTVVFEFDYRPPISGVVIHLPTATGDAWVVQDPEGRVAYVQSYSVMARAAITDDVGFGPANDNTENSEEGSDAKE